MEGADEVDGISVNGIKTSSGAGSSGTSGSKNSVVVVVDVVVVGAAVVVVAVVVGWPSLALDLARLLKAKFVFGLSTWSGSTR
jgi:hypothetical protein